MRPLLLALSVAVVAMAAAVVPLPLYELSPGPAIPVDDIADVPGDGADSRYLVPTVQLDEPSLVDTLLALVDDDTHLEERSSIVPSGVGDDDHLRLQQQLFDESVRLAVAVGLRAAGREVEIEGAGAQVLAVADDAPAREVLEVGDVIVEVDGRPVRLAADLATALDGREVGDDVPVGLERDGERLEASVELDALGDERDRPGLGVLVRTVDRALALPDDVRFGDLSVGGPSGGLLVAVAAYDRATAGAVAGDLVVAGSGTIDASGDVGAIGGVRSKVVAARDAGADLFLVPPGNADAARDEAGDDLEVVAVADLVEAIGALTARAG